MVLETYAQRLLNPFRGVMNIIEYQGAEAVTTDGIRWDIYVRDTELVQELANSRQVQTSDIRYGSWSEAQGLKRGPIYPSDDFKILEHRGAVVYEYLLQHHGEVPFPLKDDLELWLLDEQAAPLALLDSAVREEDLSLDGPIDWRAGRECRRRFATPSLEELPATTSAGEYLTRHVNDRAGPSPRAQWFRRRAGGAGEGLTGVGLAPALQGRQLGAEAFPAYYLAEADPFPAHVRLIQDFIAWQAPWHLLRQDLSRQARSRFERLAQGRALDLDRQHRLYPEILDIEGLRAARVEAALRRGQPESEDEEEAMATYYIELNVTRTN